MPARQWYTTAPILGGGKRVRSLEERRLRGEIPGPGRISLTLPWEGTEEMGPGPEEPPVRFPDWPPVPGRPEDMWARLNASTEPPKLRVSMRPPQNKLLPQGPSLVNLNPPLEEEEKGPWVLPPQPDTPLPQTDSQRELRRFQLGVRGLTKRNFLDALNWQKQNTPPDIMAEYRSNAKRFKDMGYIDNEEDYINLELSDVTADRIGLESEEGHRLVDRMFPGLRKRFPAQGYEPPGPGPDVAPAPEVPWWQTSGRTSKFSFPLAELALEKIVAPAAEGYSRYVTAPISELAQKPLIDRTKEGAWESPFVTRMQRLLGGSRQATEEVERLGREWEARPEPFPGAKGISEAVFDPLNVPFGGIQVTKQAVKGAKEAIEAAAPTLGKLAREEAGGVGRRVSKPQTLKAMEQLSKVGYLVGDPETAASVFPQQFRGAFLRKYADAFETKYRHDFERQAAEEQFYDYWNTKFRKKIEDRLTKPSPKVEAPVAQAKQPATTRFRDAEGNLIRKQPREVWQSTRKDYVFSHKEPQNFRYPLNEQERDLGIIHKKAIQQALSEGTTIPPEVLKDYPDLVAQAKPVVAPETAPGLRPAAPPVTSVTTRFREGLNARSVFEGGEVSPNLDVSWRSMGPVEYNRLVSGEAIGGGKPGTKGQYWSWFPSRASAEKGAPGRPKFLVEVRIRSGDAENIVRPATLSDVTGVWKSEGKGWTQVEVPKGPVRAAPPAEAVAPRAAGIQRKIEADTITPEDVETLSNAYRQAMREGRTADAEGIQGQLGIAQNIVRRKAAELPPQVAPQPAKAPLPPPVAAGAGAEVPPARPVPAGRVPPVVEERPPVPPAPSEPLPPSIRPPEPIPPSPGGDPIQRALDYAKVQVERERPGFITRAQVAIPGLRQARIAVQKALDMPKHVLEGWVAQGNVEGMLAQELAVSRIPLLKRLEAAFGKGAASSSDAKVPGIRFIGTPDQVAPFNGTLYDIMQRPHLYDLRATEKALLEELQQAKSANLNRLRQGYQLEIGEFPTEAGSVHLPNVDVSESALDVTGSVETALRRGRAKERFYKTGFDRWQHDKTFKPETNVANLLTADDQILVGMAGKQVYAKGIGGKTRLEAMQETHPVLAAKMEALKRRLNSLKATEGRLDAKQQQAVDDFLASPVEETDLAALRQELEPAITRGVNIGKTQADINRELQGIRAQIAALQPAWRVANLKPYQFVQEGGYRYFKPDEAEHIRRLAKISQNRFVRVLDDIRGGKLSGDFSPGTIQGVILVTSDPIGTGRLAASEFKMAFQKRQLLRPFTEEGLLSWVQENPELARRFSEATGMSILEKVGPEWAGGWVGKVPGIGKPWATFNDAIFRPLKRAGLDVFKSSYEAAQGLGLSEKEAMAVAADDVRKIIPRWNFRLLGQSQAEETWMRAPLTSVSFLTQTTALFTDAVKGYGKLGIGRWGSITPNERFAMKRVTTMIASIELMAILSNVKHAMDNDLDVEQAIKDSVNPDSGKFMAIVLPELKVAGRVIVPEGSRVTVGGPMRSLIRAVVPRMVKVAGVEVPLPFVGIPQYLQGKFGPGPRIPLDLLRNRDFYDNKIMTGEFPMNIVQGLAYVAESAMPLSISGPMAVRRQGYGAEKMIAEGVSQLGGTSLNLQTPSQGRNEAVQRWAKTENIKTFEDEPVFSYYELTGEEARRFDRAHPAESQAIRQDIDRRAAVGDENAIVQKDKLERYDRQLALDAALDAGVIVAEKGKKGIPFGRTDWRESYERQQTESAATRIILEKIRNKTYPEPENEGEKALKGYYDLMETFRIPESGYFRVEDWVEAKEKYLAGLGAKEAEYVKKKLHPWATPTVREFLKAQDTLRPYWRIGDNMVKTLKKAGDGDVQPLLDEWRIRQGMPKEGHNLSRIREIENNNLYKLWQRQVDSWKLKARFAEEAIDDALVEWYGLVPVRERKKK